MFLNELSEPQLLVVYPGRFQPFHKGHHAVFEWLSGKFGRNNVIIATSNKVEPPRSPFTFAEKAYFMQLTGVPADRIVQATSPYNIQNVLSGGQVSVQDPNNTVVIFAVSEKDMAEDPRFGPNSFTKKDGSPAYLQKLVDIKQTENMSQHAYIMTVPTFDFNVLGQPMRSGTELREMYTNADTKTRKAIIKDLFGAYTPEAEKIMNTHLPNPADAEPVVDSKLTKTTKLKTVPKPKATIKEAVLPTDAPPGSAPQTATAPQAQAADTAQARATAQALQKGLAKYQQLYPNIDHGFATEFIDHIEPDGTIVVAGDNSTGKIKALLAQGGGAQIRVVNQNELQIAQQRPQIRTMAEGSEKQLLKQVKQYCRDAWMSNGKLWIEGDPVQARWVSEMLNVKPIPGSVSGQYAFDIKQGVAEGFSLNGITKFANIVPSFLTKLFTIGQEEAQRTWKMLQILNLKRQGKATPAQIKFMNEHWKDLVVIALGVGMAGHAAIVGATHAGVAGAVTDVAKDEFKEALADNGLEYAAELLFTKFGVDIIKKLVHMLSTRVSKRYDRNQKIQQKSQAPNIGTAGDANVEKMYNKAKTGFGGMAEGLSDTQKKIEDTILKLEQRLKFAKTPEQWDNIKNRIERLQAGLTRSKTGVAEDMYDTVTFGVDSEKAYNQVMAKFGKAISWDGDDMVAPRKYWAAIQQSAHDAGGAAEETGHEQDVAESGGVGVVKGGRDPRYSTATMGDQNDVNGNTLGQEMRAFGLTGRKNPGATRTQRPVNKNVGKGIHEQRQHELEKMLQNYFK